MGMPTSPATRQMAAGSSPGERSPGSSRTPQTSGFAASACSVEGASGSEASTPTMALKRPGKRSMHSNR